MQNSYLIPRILLAVCLSAGLVGCGEDQNPCGEGHDNVPNIIDEDTDLQTYWIGQIEVNELDQITGADPGHDTQVQAFFKDFTDFRVQLAERLYFREGCPDLNPEMCACFIYTSQQVTSGTSVDLAVTGVTFTGLAGGELALTPDAVTKTIPPEILNGSGYDAAQIGIAVAAGTGAADFPAFSETIRAPAKPVITRLGDEQNPSFATAPSLGITIDREAPLVVQWQAGSGDFVEFKIIPGAGSATKYQKLRCITFDDGCLEVPGSALAHLSLDEAVNFQVKLERHNFVLRSIQEGSTTKAAAIIETSSSVEATVGR